VALDFVSDDEAFERSPFGFRISVPLGQPAYNGSVGEESLGGGRVEGRGSDGNGVGMREGMNDVGWERRVFSLVGEEDSGDFLAGFFCALERGVEVADGVFVEWDGGAIGVDLVRGVRWGVGE